MRAQNSLLAVPTLLMLSSCFVADPCHQVLCGPCEPALTVVVRDAATDGPVLGVEVSGAEATCEAATQTVCTSSGAGSGTYSLTVTAPGYLAEEVTVEVPFVDTSGTCCGCPFEAQTVIVELRRE